MHPFADTRRAQLALMLDRYSEAGDAVRILAGLNESEASPAKAVFAYSQFTAGSRDKAVLLLEETLRNFPKDYMSAALLSHLLPGHTLVGRYNSVLNNDYAKRRATIVKKQGFSYNMTNRLSIVTSSNALYFSCMASMIRPTPDRVSGSTDRLSLEVDDEV